MVDGEGDHAQRMVTVTTPTTPPLPPDDRCPSHHPHHPTMVTVSDDHPRWCTGRIEQTGQDLI